MYYHAADSSTAVRNRKNYFIDQVSQLEESIKNPYVLNLGCGPCRDVQEFLSLEKNHNNTLFDCIDMDNLALEYASKVCSDYLDRIVFIHKNVCHFKPEKEYNMIWSAGLFDYFSNKLFIRLTNKLYQFLGKYSPFPKIFFRT